jgi:hypothetical protein
MLRPVLDRSRPGQQICWQIPYLIRLLDRRLPLPAVVRWARLPRDTSGE